MGAEGAPRQRHFFYTKAGASRGASPIIATLHLFSESQTGEALRLSRFQIQEE